MADSYSTNTSSIMRTPDAGVLGPFRYRVFTILLSATIVSNIGTWMQNAAASWLMTDITSDPFIVSLVQVATSLPMFVLALPAGALADVVDRRRLLIVLQIIIAGTAAGFGIMVLRNWINAEILLGFMLLASAAAALMAPVWQSIVAQLVPHELLQRAVALNGAGVNVSRAVGPAFVGLIIAAWGIAGPFLLNSIATLGVIGALAWWRPQRRDTRQNLPPEQFFRAIGTGLRYAAHNPHLVSTLIRALGFFTFASAYWALLPLVARNQISGGSAVYGILLGAIGVGAVTGTFVLPPLRKRLGADWLEGAAALGTAIALVLFAFAQNVPTALVASAIAGMSWMAGLTTLNVSTQVAVSEWVRGRGLSIYYTVMFASMTLGSALWGKVASWAGLPTAHLLAAIGALIAVPMLWRWKLQTGALLDLTPSLSWPEPATLDSGNADRGPILVTVEYLVRAEDRADFLKAIIELAEERWRDGAYSWHIYEDIDQQGRFVEGFMLSSWLEHLRQHHRITDADRKLQTLVDRFQVGGPPKVTHLVAAT